MEGEEKGMREKEGDFEKKIDEAVEELKDSFVQEVIKPSAGSTNTQGAGDSGSGFKPKENIPAPVYAPPRFK